MAIRAPDGANKIFLSSNKTYGIWLSNKMIDCPSVLSKTKNHNNVFARSAGGQKYLSRTELGTGFREPGGEGSVLTAIDIEMHYSSFHLSRGTLVLAHNKPVHRDRFPMEATILG